MWMMLGAPRHSDGVYNNNVLFVICGRAVLCMHWVRRRHTLATPQGGGDTDPDPRTPANTTRGARGRPRKRRVESLVMEDAFSCRRCRGPLFRAAHVTAHVLGAHRFSRHRLNKDAAAGSLAPPRSGADDAPLDEGACTSFFLAEALEWMRGASEGVEGKLHCPHCTARVGTLRWAGAQCSCGTWVTPAVQIARKAVDPPRASPQPAIPDCDGTHAAGGALDAASQSLGRGGACEEER